jgi:hypothetical protein
MIRKGRLRRRQRSVDLVGRDMEEAGAIKRAGELQKSSAAFNRV